MGSWISKMTEWKWGNRKKVWNFNLQGLNAERIKERAGKTTTMIPSSMIKFSH